MFIVPWLLFPGCGDSKDTTAADSAETDTSDSAVVTGEVSAVEWRLNPDIASVVHVSWEQSAAADVYLEFAIAGEEWASSPVERRDAGAQEELVLGVPFDADFTFRVVADFGSGPVSSGDIAARTGPLPETLPLPDLHTTVPEAWDPANRWLLFSVSASDEGFDSSGTWKVILDRQARVVWAHLTPDAHRTLFMQTSQDRSAILWDENTFWTDFDEGAGSEVHRSRIDGTLVETVPTAGQHHTFIELPDGTIAWGAIDEARDVVKERALDGTVTERWDCSLFWVEQGSRDNCDGNGMYYNADDDTIYYSSDVGHSVVEIDRATGSVVRLFGQLPGAYTFAELDTTFWKQHGPTRTPEGNFMVSTWASDRDHELRAREYEIDDEGRTLRMVWTCGEGTGTEAPFLGGAYRLDNGNTLLNYGGGGAFREYTQACEEVWYVSWPDQNTLGRAEFLSDLYSLAG